MESVEYLGFLIEVVSPEAGTYEYSVFDMTGKDKPEFPIYETDDVGFVSFGAALDDAKSWIRDFLIDDDERAAEHIENLYATKKALSHSQSVETTGIVTQKLTADVFNRPDCPEWAKYAVVNKDGSVFVFSSKPFSRSSGWAVTFNATEIQTDFMDIGKYDASDWENSLIERPAKELPDWCKVGEWVFADPEKLFGPAGYKKIKAIDGLELTFADGCCIYFSDNIKQARLRPYSAEEMRGLVGKVLKTSDGDLQLITAYYSDSERVLVGGLVDRPADEIKERYTHLDGKPCGNLVHKEGDDWVE